jgi:hypothetical protein
MKKRRDLRLLGAAALLLLGSAAWLLWSSRSETRRREAVLAGVPKFPVPGQPPRRRPLSVTHAASSPLPPPPAPARHDSIASFALQSGGGAVVQVNALFNTPLFDRLRQCLPGDFAALDSAGKELGLDVSRDVDRIALASGGVAVSGFFAEKPIARTIAGGDPREEYLGAAIFHRPGGRCVAQMGNLLLFGESDDCRGLVDRALAPTPADAADQLYGDLFLRSDLAPYRSADAPPEIRALADGLESVTLRANVWDSVALTVEGTPQPGRSLQDLAQMAQGAIAVVKSQLDEDQVELRTLSDLANVAVKGGRLELELALPADDLFDRLHFPCPGRDGG